MPSTIVDNSTTQASTKIQTEDIRSLQKTDNQNTTTSFKETHQEINQQENSKKEERQRKKQERKLKKTREEKQTD